MRNIEKIEEALKTFTDWATSTMIAKKAEEMGFKGLTPQRVAMISRQSKHIERWYITRWKPLLRYKQ